MPQWTAGGVRLPDGPYIIGAGVCKNPDTTELWLTVAPVVSGSYTAEARTGNSGRVVYPESLEEFLTLGYGLNSFGMPNMGFKAAATLLSDFRSVQPLIVSVAGFGVAEYIEGVRIFNELRSVSAIELNFGCPNTQGDHPDIMSFNPGAIRKLLEMLCVSVHVTKPIWLKFSPFSNPAELKRMAELVNQFAADYTLAVVTCNTFPNSYGGDVIDPNNGLSGLSGPKIKEFARGQVRWFKAGLDSAIDIIAVGGITTGDDIVDLLEDGAKAVQLTSLPFWAGNPDAFFEQLMNPETSSRFIEHLTDDI